MIVHKTGLIRAFHFRGCFFLTSWNLPCYHLSTSCHHSVPLETSEATIRSLQKEKASDQQCICHISLLLWCRNMAPEQNSESQAGWRSHHTPRAARGVSSWNELMKWADPSTITIPTGSNGKDALVWSQDNSTPRSSYMYDHGFWPPLLSWLETLKQAQYEHGCL